MTIENKTTVNATANAPAAENPANAPAPIWVGPAPMTERVELVSIETIRTAFLGGSLKVPSFQRDYVWGDIKGQVERYRDTLLTGLAVPARIIAELTTSSGVVRMLVDGLQRTTTESAILDELEQSDDEREQMKADYINARLVPVHYVECATLEQVAELFVRYNSGKALDGLQKGKAQLSPDKLVAVKPYIEAAAATGIIHFGKKTADATGLMLAACAVDFAAYSGDKKPRAYKRQASTSGAPSAKALAKAASVPALCEPIRDTLEALKTATSPAAMTYWASPARLIPLAWAAMETGAGVDTLRDIIDTLNTNASAPTYTVYYAYKSGVVTRKSMSAATVFGNASNAAAATAARADWLTAYITRRASSTAETGDVADVAAVLASALEN